MLMDIITAFDQWVCGLTGHDTLVRERFDGDEEKGEKPGYGLRCKKCMKVMPNTFESLGVTPPNPNYQPGKAGDVRVGAA